MIYLTIKIWLVVYLPLWKILVTWDYCSQYMKKNMFQTTNQYNYIYIYILTMIYLTIYLNYLSKYLSTYLQLPIV